MYSVRLNDGRERSCDLNQMRTDLDVEQVDDKLLTPNLSLPNSEIPNSSSATTKKSSVGIHQPSVLILLSISY